MAVIPMSEETNEKPSYSLGGCTQSIKKERKLDFFILCLMTSEVFYSDFRLLTKEIFVNDIKIWFQRKTHFTPSISWRIPIFKNLMCLAPQDRLWFHQRYKNLRIISYIFTLKTELRPFTSEPTPKWNQSLSERGCLLQFATTKFEGTVPVRF